MELTSEIVLKSAGDFMKEVGAHTPESKAQFDNLSDMEKNLQVVKRSQSENSELIETLENTLSDNVLVRCNVVAHALALDDWEKTMTDESKLPEAIQILLKGIRRHLEKLKGKNAVLDALTNKLNSKLKEFIKQKFQISEKEMIEFKIIVMKLESEIEIAESWQKEADDAWTTLNSEATSYREVENEVGNRKAAATSFVAAGAALGGAMYYGAHLYNKLLTGVSAGLVAYGAQSFYQIHTIHSKYKEIKAKILQLKVNLDDVRKQKDYKISGGNIKTLVEKELKVKDNENGDN